MPWLRLLVCSGWSSFRVSQDAHPKPCGGQIGATPHTFVKSLRQPSLLWSAARCLHCSHAGLCFISRLRGASFFLLDQERKSEWRKRLDSRFTSSSGLPASLFCFKRVLGIVGSPVHNVCVYLEALMLLRQTALLCCAMGWGAMTSKLESGDLFSCSCWFCQLSFSSNSPIFALVFWQWLHMKTLDVGSLDFMSIICALCLLNDEFSCSLVSLQGALCKGWLLWCTCNCSWPRICFEGQVCRNISEYFWLLVRPVLSYP